MDDSKFDALIKQLGSDRSRRSTLRLVGGAVLAGAAALAGIGEAAAIPPPVQGRCRAESNSCATGGDCCSGLCISTGRGRRGTCGCTADVQCWTGSGRDSSWTCQSNVCVGLGCFIAGTPIAIPGGASRTIELFLPGDEVVGAGGRINRVLQLERKPLGVRQIYAVNDSNFFVSPEHVFASDGEWRAIDFRGAMHDDPTIHVEPLRVGDAIHALSHAPAYAMAGGHEAPAMAEPIRVTSLTGCWAEPSTEIFNLLLDGDMTYFANGFLVHD